MKWREGIKKCPQNLRYITVESAIKKREKNFHQSWRDVPLAGLLVPVGNTSFCSNNEDPRFECNVIVILQQISNNGCSFVAVPINENDIFYSIFEKHGTGSFCKMEMKPARVVVWGVLIHSNEYSKMIPSDICLLDDPDSAPKSP